MLYPPLKIHLGFAKANGVFIVITSAKILPRWLFPSKIYILFTIFNTYFLTKLLFTNKRYHLHVLEKCLYVLQIVRSITYFLQFIHPFSLCSWSNGTSFAFTLYILVLAKFCDVTCLNNFYFISFFYLYFIHSFVHLPAPKKNKTCDIKQKLFIWTFLLKFLFGLLSIFLCICLYFWTQRKHSNYF